MQVSTQKEGYGQLLQKARSTAGLSQQTVAEKLRLDPKLVQAIEQEDPKGLPAPAYVRGYIRAYAQLLECDAESIVQKYNLTATSEPELIQTDPVESYQASKKPWVLWSLMVMVLLLATATVVWLLVLPNFNVDQVVNVVSAPIEEPAADIISQQEAAMAEYAAAEDLAIEAGPEADVFSESTVAVESEAELSAELAVEQNFTDEQASVVSEPEAPKAASADQEEAAFDISAMPDRQDVVLRAPYGTDQLSLSFAGACWVEVVDANGFRLLFGLFSQADEALTVKGQAPFQIILGNAHFVTLNVNENAFELAPYIRSNNTARVLLDSTAKLYQKEQ